jgi:hypothetical protein
MIELVEVEYHIKIELSAIIQSYFFMTTTLDSGLIFVEDEAYLCWGVMRDAFPATLNGKMRRKMSVASFQKTGCTL